MVTPRESAVMAETMATSGADDAIRQRSSRPSTEARKPRDFFRSEGPNACRTALGFTGANPFLGDASSGFLGEPGDHRDGRDPAVSKGWRLHHRRRMWRIEDGARSYP